MSSLKKLRLKLGYSLDFVSANTELDRKTVTAAENGNCQTYRTAKILSLFFDGIVSPEQILAYRGESNAPSQLLSGQF